MVYILVPKQHNSITDEYALDAIEYEIQNNYENTDHYPNVVVMSNIIKSRYEEEKLERIRLEKKLSSRDDQLDVLSHWLELYRYRMCEIERLSVCQVACNMACEARQEFYRGLRKYENLFQLTGVTML